MKHKAILIVFAILLLFAAAACGGGETNAPAAPSADPAAPVESPTSARSVINIGVDVDAEVLNPVLWNDTTATRVGSLVYNGLIHNDHDLVAQPALATSWEQVDDVTWVFYLRQGVKFHDGSDFTAADVKYTFEREIDPTVPAPNQSLYSPIQSVDIIDDYTVQFNLSSAYAPFIAYCDLGIMPEGAMDDSNFGQNPIGTGPYKLTSWTRNSIITLEANADYWDGVPATPNINIYVIPDNSVRITALESGDVDYICSPVTATDIPLVESNNELVVQKTFALGFTYLGFNFDHEILADDAVRQAIAMMVDKDTIAATFYGGMDTPATTPVQPYTFAYSDKLHGYAYDPDGAKAVLDAAGWIDADGDGVREKDGKPLAFTLSTHTEDSSRMQTVEFLQNQLTGIGMGVKVNTTEWLTYFDDMQQGRLEMWLAGWLNLIEVDMAMYNQFHSTGGTNYGHYSNPQVDEWVTLGRTSSAVSERIDVYQKAAQQLIDDVAYIMLLDQAFVAMHDKDLQGFDLHPAGNLYSFRNATITE